MNPGLIAALCCALTTAPPPFGQSWSDTGLITVDDDWSRVPAIVGYRGDGLVSEPGVDPRKVLADGATTPVDVAANRTDPGAVGMAAGVAEFELPDPVVAIQGSATASAPQLVVALDTRARAGIAVKLGLRDIDASAADAVEPVAVQYRVGGAGEFANAPGGYVADATTGPGVATAVTELRTVLPSAVDDQRVVELRVITTDAGGRDEWVGVDDIEVSAAGVAGPGDCGGEDPPPGPGPSPAPGPPPSPAPGPEPGPGDPRRRSPELSGLTLAPERFTAARRGPAIVRRGRAGAALRFRLSKAALVRFQVEREAARSRWRAMPVAESIAFPTVPVAKRFGFQTTPVAKRFGFPTTPVAKRFGFQTTPLAKRFGFRLVPGADHGRFQVRGRRGLNRMRFTGRIRGRALAGGVYTLTAVAVDRAGRESMPNAVRFEIGGNQG
jgi:hypothetical protein